MAAQGSNTEIIPYIFYRDVPAALDWLARAFGFTEELRHPTPSGMHAQMTLDGQRIMMAASLMPRPAPPCSAGIAMPSQPAAASSACSSCGKSPERSLARQ